MILRSWRAYALLSITIILLGCKLGYNRSPRPADSGQKPPECAVAPSNTSSDSTADSVFRVLADLTCFESEYNGNMLGQILGSGDQISEEDGDKSYAALVETLTEEQGVTPVVIEIDYALDERYDATVALLEANDQLEQHWSKGGLVSIAWSPLNPWLEEQGDDDEDLSKTAYTADVDLAELIDESSNIYGTWIEYLDEMFTALDNMRRRGIVVLWRPLPEMNDDQFWWGIQANANEDDEDDATLYTAVWKHMYNYFKDSGLDNLLWVYSPVDGDSTASEDAKSSTWAYPGEDYTDIIAPVVRADSLQIRDYEDYLELEKPLGVASWGPSLDNSSSLSERFDAKAYSDRLIQSYPFVSYWMAPYSQELSDSETSYQALIDLDEITGLTDRAHSISLELAIEEGLLSTRTEVFDNSNP